MLILSRLMNSEVGIAQNLPVIGFQPLEEYLRRGQLTGEVSQKISFSKRPVNFSAIDSSRLSVNEFSGFEVISAFNNDLKIEVLPLSSGIQYNRFQPYGRNNGAMIPARGFQQLSSAGVHVKYKNLSLQARPEVHYARNLPFFGFPDVHYEIIWSWRYQLWNIIDRPEKFGDAKMLQLLPGQSNIKFQYGAFEVGASTENRWWGPARRNALVLSNNAGGFLHTFLSTAHPIPTKIGNFEGELIAGGLENSTFTPPQPDRLFYFAPLYHPKREERRFMSGIHISWQPIWINGLTLGINKAQQVYNSELSKLEDFVPFINTKSDRVTDSQVDLTPTDHYSSFFLRWIFEEANAEIYSEYGNHGRPRKWRDRLVEPEKNRGYTFGLIKLFPLNKNRYLQLSSEFTQLQQSQRAGIINVNSWYANDHIRHGYTHRGQVLGAGIGPGSNSQFIELGWVSDLNRIAIQLERLVVDNDFTHFAFWHTGDFRRHWIDHILGFEADWKIRSVLISARFHYIKTINYQWELVFEPNLPWFRPGRDVTNFHYGLSLIAPITFIK